MRLYLAALKALNDALNAIFPTPVRSQVICEDDDNVGYWMGPPAWSICPPADEPLLAIMSAEDWHAIEAAALSEF